MGGTNTWDKEYSLKPFSNSYLKYKDKKDDEKDHQEEHRYSNNNKGTTCLTIIVQDHKRNTEKINKRLNKVKLINQKIKRDLNREQILKRKVEQQIRKPFLNTKFSKINEINGKNFFISSIILFYIELLYFKNNVHFLFRKHTF